MKPNTGTSSTRNARLADLLTTLEPEQWALATLCADWTVEQVVAHLTAAANTGKWAWIRSIVRAGFDPAKHNARLLERRLGGSPEETLAKFCDSTALTIAPTNNSRPFSVKSSSTARTSPDHWNST